MFIKTKSRDIVSGWPRGKSTGGLGLYSADRAYEDLHWFLFFGRGSWTKSDIRKIIEEYEETEIYHKNQQEMVDASSNRWLDLCYSFDKNSEETIFN